MPLLKGKSKAVISKNIKELTSSKPGKTRAKAIATLSKKTGMTPKQAQAKMAVAIAYSKAGKSRKKK